MLISVCVVSFSQAQQDALTQILVEEMEVDDKYSIHLFAGTLDSHHPIRMVLATQDSLCKGVYEFVNSGVVFKLRGFIHADKKIDLVEVDNSEATCGTIKGYYDDLGIYLKWKNIIELNELDLNFVAVERFSSRATATEENLKRIEAKYSNKKLTLFLNDKKKNIQVEGVNFPNMNFQYECHSIDCNAIISKHCLKKKDIGNLQRKPSVMKNIR